MSKEIRLKYQLDDVPPLGELLLQGLQWLITALPIFIMIAKVAAGIHYEEGYLQVIYIQKVLFLSALALLGQVFWGHRLPLVIGPATVLLIALASGGKGPAAAYTAQSIGGAALFLLSASGYFKFVKRLFTPRVVAVILLLIAVTISPTIISLLFAGAEQQAWQRFIFVIALLGFLCWGNRFFRGIGKTTLIFWGVLLGSLVYGWVFTPPEFLGGGFVLRPLNILTRLNLNLELEPGMLIAYLLCFLALAVNDLGSIQSIAVLLQVDDTEKRITAGEGLTGLINVLGGLLGVIGVVNYSLSPGIISTTASASRYALLPAALGMLLIAFLPGAIGLVAAIPSPVIGCVLLYVMSSQIAAGLVVATTGTGKLSYEEGLIIGVPVMLAMIVAFLSPAVLESFPIFLRPLLGNSLVVGVVAVLLMERIYSGGKAEL